MLDFNPKHKIYSTKYHRRTSGKHHSNVNPALKTEPDTSVSTNVYKKLTAKKRCFVQVE